MVFNIIMFFIITLFAWIYARVSILLKCGNHLYNRIISLNKKHHTVRTIQKSNIKIVERKKIDTPNIQINDRSLSPLSTDTPAKCGGAKPATWSKPPLLVK
jgi:hypothetical protein